MGDRAYARQIVAIFIALSLAVIGAGSAYVAVGRKQLKRAKFNELESIADLKTNGIVDWISELEKDGTFYSMRSNRASQLRRLIDRPNDAAARADMETFSLFLMNTYGYRAVRLYRRTGAGTALVFAFPAGYDHTGPAVFDEPGNAPLDRISLGDFFRVPEDGRLGISLRIPIEPSGRADRGASDILTLEIDPNRSLYPMIRRWPIASASGESLLVKKDGDDVLFLNDLRFGRDVAMTLRIPLEGNGRIPAVMAVGGKQGGVEGIDYRGKPIIAWIRAIPGTDWKIVTKIDRDEALAPISPAEAAIGLAIVTFIAAGGFGAAAARRSALSALELRASRAEVKRLEAAARFEYLARFANDAILLVDAANTIREANESAQRLYGAGRELLIGTDFRDLQTEPAPYENERRDDRAASEERGYRFQTQHARKSGGSVWVDVSARAFSSPGERMVQLIVRDISEEKRAHDALLSSMAEKEVLLRELYHRTKNNMQVITSLLVLKSDELQDERIRDAFMEMVGRIRAMALVHEKLYQSDDLSKIELGQYVRDLAELIIGELSGTDIRLSVARTRDAIRVPIDTAIPCGLVLNELLTNAFKHAFDGKKGKLIAVKLERDEEGISMRVADNGKGMPAGFDIVENGRMGWQTIAGITETQLRGSVEIVSKRGTTVIVRFPEAEEYRKD